MDLNTWCSLSEAERATKDIALVNLCAAGGLPNAERLDVGEYLQRLDQCASVVRERTRKHLRRRRKELSDRDLTDNQFRIMSMVQTLQRELGLRYNPAFSEGEYDARDSRNLFIHALLEGPWGTCSNSPVLYAAIGRRLDYPIKLAATNEHMFCRWDGQGESFNIEATCRGYKSPTDEHYRTLRGALTQTQIDRCGFLKSLSPREELAAFIVRRGNCWMDNLESDLALDCYYHAYRLVPGNNVYNNCWACGLLTHRIMQDVKRQANERRQVIEVRIPTIEEPWQEGYAQAATDNMNRIMRNRGLKQVSATGKNELSFERSGPCTIQVLVGL